MSNSSQQQAANYSIEFFPPRTPEGEARLLAVHEDLARLNPAFFSVTYGAGGSTRAGTKNIVMELHELGSQVAPHLSFGGSSDSEINELLQEYRAAGINRLVALRGDIPSGMGTAIQHRYASELVSFVRETTGDHFHIEVACYPETHPQAPGAEADINFFKAKVEAGANSAITQYFYNPDAYFQFVEQCGKTGIEVPIVPGIMPITNYANLAKFSAGCGAEIPRWLHQNLKDFGDDAGALKQYGIEVVTRLCQTLLDGGAPGLHFYSMNQSSSVSALWKNLNLPTGN